MFNQGVLRLGENGSVEPVLDPEESESIRQQVANASRRSTLNEADIDRINAQLEEIRGTIKAYEDKVRLCVE